MKIFKASLDSISKGLTIFCAILSVFIPVTLLVPLYNLHTVPGSALLIAAPAIIILWGLIVAMYLYRPLEYGIDGNTFFIRRPIGKYKIELTHIKTVAAVDAKEMGFAIRTFGNGGLFGYTGYYYSKNIGKMVWYATQRKNYILMEIADNRKIVITPDDPKGFLSQLQLSTNIS